MKTYLKLMLLLVLTEAVLPASGQSTKVFYNDGGTINNCPGTCTSGDGDCFPISVSGVGTLSSTYGVVKVCFSITGTRSYDYDIILKAPDGTTCTLVNDAGSSSGNYTNGFCLTEFGPDNTGTACNAAPTTITEGNYTPTQLFSTVLNNPGTINANGTWNLCVRDDHSSGAAGTLNFASITFGPTSTEANPNGTTCANAVTISALPFFRPRVNVGASTDSYTGCGSSLAKKEYVFKYTPANNEYITIRANYWSPAVANPTLSLLDGCPGTGTCIASEKLTGSTGMLNITAQPITAGTTYYIICSSELTDNSLKCDLDITAGYNGNDNCSSATVLTNTTPFAGNNISTPNPNSSQAPTVGAGNEMPCNGASNNFIYYKFTTSSAASPQVKLSVFDIDCGAGASGLQVSLFKPTTACTTGSWGTAVACQSSVLTTDTYYSWTGLLSNTTYYLVIDGVAGDQCAWNMRFTGDFIDPLPVSLMNFKSKCLNGNTILEWTTASEVNNNYFRLESSDDGENFKTISIIDANGNSRKETRYSFTDFNRKGKEKTYYKLSQTDYDGKTQNVGLLESVSCEKNINSAKVLYDENSNLKIQIESKYEATLKMEIVDIAGRKILEAAQEINEGLSIFPLNISELNKGMYLLSLKSIVNNEMQTLKIIVP